MTCLTWCDQGHQYSAAEYYVDWPEGLPKCPVCRKEWAQKQAINWRAIELLSGLKKVIMNLPNRAEKHDFILEANMVIGTLDLKCFYEMTKGMVYLIDQDTGLRIGTV